MIFLASAQIVSLIELSHVYCLREETTACLDSFHVFFNCLVKIHNQKDKHTDSVTLLLYENKKGGNGYFNELIKFKRTSGGKEIRVIEDIIRSMWGNLSSCKCKNGCLNCGFLLYSCIKNNKYINKQLTLDVLENIKTIRNNNTS